MLYFVYILKCRDKTLYTGITWNLEKRVKDHFNGSSKYTRGRLPVKLVYFEKHKDKIDAMRKEREIKGFSRIKKIELIKNSRRANQNGV